MPVEIQENRKISTLIALIIAGESVFFLPFVMARIFRPTLLDVFGISNTELGSYFFIYGIVAMVSYMFGGPLADRFPARNLMALALWLTSLGGFLMVFIPPSLTMTIIYGFWGFTTVCLFWAALIRATREWGGAGFQGRAFGWLEGGRGAAAALLGTLAFILFALISPDNPVTEAASHSFHPFQYVILSISVATLLSGVLVWFFVPATQTSPTSAPVRDAIQGIRKLLAMPTIWLLSIMIICAYVGYKITDDFSLYAREVLGFSEVGSAGIGTAALWLRAIVAILAGYMADRLNRTNVILVCFALTVAGGLLMGSGLLSPVAGLALANLALTATGIYGIRALYFAILKEAGIPLALTGTAVGIVCFVGFTPDVFMSPWMGYLLDKSPGEEGHRDVFLVLALFAFFGLISSLVFKYYQRLSNRFIRFRNR